MKYDNAIPLCKETMQNISGGWVFGEDIEITAFDTSIIYQSDEEPSHVCWAGVWKDKYGAIRARFQEITGDPGLEPSYAPRMKRYQNGTFTRQNTWEEQCATMLLNPGPTDAVARTKNYFVTVVSRDNGVTWEIESRIERGIKEFEIPMYSDESCPEWGYNAVPVCTSDNRLVGGDLFSVIRCRDGRLVSAISAMEWLDATGADYTHPKKIFLVGIKESFDEGKTWMPTDYVKLEDSPSPYLCEEVALAETSDGRILAIVRQINPAGHPFMFYLMRNKNGEYIATKPVETQFTHSGMPSLRRCSDGTIWYINLMDGLYYTIDDGQNWNKLQSKYFYETYYAKLIEGEQCQLLCISQKYIGDSEYPHSRNSYIGQMKLSYSRISTLMQTDTNNAIALTVVSGDPFADLHLTADVRLDKADGLAFGISQDGRTYYALMLIMPGGEQYRRWYPSSTSGEALSAYFPGLLDEHTRERLEQGIFDISDIPLLVLAKIENGNISVLRGMCIDPAKIYKKTTSKTKCGSWVRMQVKVTGNLLQGAVMNLNDSIPAIYVGYRDKDYEGGAVGVITDVGSLGVFKNLRLWKTPQYIRDLWDD